MTLNHTARLAVGVLGALLTPVLVVGLSVLVAVQVTALPSDAALRVGDVVVSKEQLGKRVKLLSALYGIRPPADPGRSDEFSRATAQSVALGMVFDQLAAQEGAIPDGQAVREALNVMIKKDFADWCPGFAKLLGTVGASEQDVLEELKRQRAMALLYEKVTGGDPAPVPDAEAREFYEAHRSDFVQPEGRHLRNIVVASASDAERVAREARAGADFAMLARRDTLDTSTRDAGGDLGQVYRAQLEPAYGDAAFGAAPGSIAGPVQTNDGWHVLQVLEVLPPMQLSYEQVGLRLRADLAKQHAVDRWRGWAGEKIDRADIEYADEYRPAQPNPVTAPAPAPPAEGKVSR